MTPDDIRRLADVLDDMVRNFEGRYADLSRTTARDLLEVADRLEELDWQRYGNAGRGKPKPGEGAVQQFTDQDKLKEVERELAMRRSLYPKWIASGKLKEEAAQRMIELMEAIAQDYRIRLNGSH